MAILSFEIPDWVPAWLQHVLAPDPEKYVPYAGHIEPGIVKLMDRSIMAMLHLHGRSFELVPNEERNARAAQINTLMRQIADADLTVCYHLVHHETVAPAPQPAMPNGFPREVMTDYERVALTGMFRNDWFISPIVRAPFMARKGWFRRGTPVLDRTDKRQHQHLEDAIRLIGSTLGEYAPRRLGMKEIETDTGSKTVTEIGTALHLIRSAELWTIPDTSGALGAAIHTEAPVFGPLAFDLGPSYRRRYGAMIGFVNYPGMCRVGMFSPLLSAPYPLVMTHSFRFLSASMVSRAMSLLQDQMKTSGDRAKDLEEGIGDALNKSASMHTTSGRHHFALAVYADDPLTLDANVADAMKRISEVGAAAPGREQNVWKNGAMMQTYYLQMPGSQLFRPRQGDISTDDLSCMASLDNYPQGNTTGYWGASPIRLKSNGLTAFDYITHDEDVGHCLVIGPNGRGKSAWAGLNMMALGPVMGDDGIRLIIDKDDSHKLMVDANGGTHQRLKRNEPSGMAPHRLSDSPRRRAFLHSLYTWLIERDGLGKLKGDADTRLMRGIARQMKLPPEKRSMGGVREFLGYSDAEEGAGARFERYCKGGSMGWLLDNDEHVIRFGAGLFAFDFTELIPREGQADDGCCEAAGAVITHQLADYMDGRRIACFFDECSFYLRPLKFLIGDYTITGRKKELACWLASQQPEHFTESEAGMSLVAQCRTKIIFPDTNYNADNLRKLELSEPAIRQVKGTMTIGNSRRFLLWRQSGATVCEFDLSDLAALPILSGRPGTIALMDRVRAEAPDRAPSETVAEFLRRLANTRTSTGMAA